MHISDLRLLTGAGQVRAEARVTWEEADRAPVDVYVEIDAQFAWALHPYPNGFALAGIIPAWHAGERRLLVEGSLCPVLRDNLCFALATLRQWYPEMGPPPALQTTQGFAPLRPADGQAVSFLSGGIDSLTALRSNRLDLPLQHQATMRGSILLARIIHE